MKLKNNHKFVLAADGSGASGKTTGAKIISRKYGLKFLSSGLLYRFASHQLLKHKPKNKVNFLKSKFKKLNYSKLNKISLHSSKISEYTSIIAKEKKIRDVLKKFQKPKIVIFCFLLLVEEACLCHHDLLYRVVLQAREIFEGVHNM